jgi:hypothetical protein
MVSIDESGHSGKEATLIVRGEVDDDSISIDLSATLCPTEHLSCLKDTDILRGIQFRLAGLCNEGILHISLS